MYCFAWNSDWLLTQTFCCQEILCVGWGHYKCKHGIKGRIFVQSQKFGQVYFREEYYPIMSALKLESWLMGFFISLPSAIMDLISVIPT